MIDTFGRKIEYMRISVTDRCNLRCRYCMPKGIELLPMDRILSYEDIVLIAEASVSLGITRFKITGGEPLVRKGVTGLVRMLKEIKGLELVTLTSNGILLNDHIDELKDAGIDGINISLDTLDYDTFGKITGSHDLEKVLTGIDKSIEYGIKTKINSVILSDLPIDNYLQLAELARDKKLDVRFIEMMPIGAGTDYESVDCNRIIQALKDKYSISEDKEIHGNGPAKYYRIEGFMGSIGIINSVHDKFCTNCNRIRLTSMGELKPCLCYGDTIPLMPLLRSYESESNKDDNRESIREDIKEKIKGKIQEAVMSKPCGHDFAVRENVSESKSMSQIGG